VGKENPPRRSFDLPRRVRPLRPPAARRHLSKVSA
jgi:hypothetical protein